MSLLDCMAAMSKALGRKLTFEEAEAFAERLDAVRRQLGREGLPDDILSAASAVREQMEIEKAIAQRNVLINRQRHAELNARRLDMGVDAATFLTALRVGINRPVEGGRLSIDAQHLEIFSSTLGGLIHDLRAAGGQGTDLLAWMLAKDHALPIARALRGERAELPPEAIAIADTIAKYREALRQRENRAGGWRGELQGYVSRQMHDPENVLRAGFDEWRAWMMENLDHARTFERDGELIGRLQMEREQVGFHLNEARQTLIDIAASLTVDRRKARQAEGRAATAERWRSELDGQLREAELEMGRHVRRYLDLAEQEQAAAQAGDAQADTRLGVQRAEVRVAIGRLRERVAALQERVPQAELRAEGRRGDADQAAGLVEAAQAALARAEKAIDLFVDTGRALRDLEARLRRPVADPATYLRDIYNRITTDLWVGHESPQFDGVHTYLGPANLAKKRAAHRELHFRDAAAELSYAERFGRGNLIENVVHELEHTARAIALMENLGPNPRAMHERLVREAMADAAEAGDTVAANDLSRAYHDNQLAEILGETRSARHGPKLAMWSSALRTWINMAKLGGATISSIADVATSAAALSRIGVNPLRAHGEAFATVLKGRRAGEQRAIADLVGVGFEGLIGSVQGRFAGTDNVAGRLARWQQMFFRLNLLNWWTDAHKTTAGLVTAAHFGQQVGKSFAQLGAPEARMLRKYGIDAAQWDVVRRAGLRRDEAGRAFLTAHGVREASLVEFQVLFADPLTVSERQLLESRDRLATAYGALIRERAEFAVPTPGAAERALMNQGTPRGTVLGEALRFVMQFKGFPIAMIHKTLGESIHGAGPAGLGSIAKTGFLVAELTAMGYLAMSAKDLLKGRAPRDPHERDTWFAALMQGGGAGIMGDFLFGEYNRFGRRATDTILGPGFGMAADAVGLFAKVIRLGQERGAPKEESLIAEALRVGVNNTAGLNLFYLRPLLDYFLLWPLSEAINPGWAQRFERRIRRENGQEFWPAWRSPTEAVR